MGKSSMSLEAIAQDLYTNDYSYEEVLEIVKEVYDLGNAKS